MVLRPVGPLPPGAYWLRRLVLVVVVVIVVAAAWWLIGGSNDQEPSGADVQPTVSQTPQSPSPSDTVQPTKTKEKTSPSSTDEPVPVCADKDLAVTVTTNAKTFGPDQLPTFILSVENTSEDTCQRDVGSDVLELRVSSGGSRIWSSDDCSPGGSARNKTLDPGSNFAESVQWSRDRSEPGCPTPQEAAAPGDYQVIAINQEINSEPAVFTLQ